MLVVVQKKISVYTYNNIILLYIKKNIYIYIKTFKYLNSIQSVIILLKKITLRGIRIRMILCILILFVYFFFHRPS